MSDLRHLLERAAPSPAGPLAVDELRERVARRRRHQRVAVVSLGVIAVAAAAGALVALLPDDEEDVGTFADESTTTTAAAPAPPGPGPVAGVEDVLATAMAVTVAGDGVWVATAEGDETFVVLLDPTSGDEVGRVDVGAPIRDIEVVGDTAWAFGPGDGRAPAGSVVAIDVATMTVVDGYGSEQGFAPYDLVATPDGTAWVADAAGDRVIRYDRSDLSEPAGEVPVTGLPTDLVLADDGRLWVRSSTTGTIVAIDPIAGDIVSTQSWDAPLFAAADDGALWSTDGSRLVQLFPDALEAGLSVALGARLTTPGSIRAVTLDGSEVWVAGGGGLAGFAGAATGATGQPTARLELDHEAFDVAVTGSHVWYVDAAGLHRWARPR